MIGIALRKILNLYFQFLGGEVIILSSKFRYKFYFFCRFYLFDCITQLHSKINFWRVDISVIIFSKKQFPININCNIFIFIFITLKIIPISRHFIVNLPLNFYIIEFIITFD